MNLYNLKSEYLFLSQELSEGELTPEFEQALIINEKNLQEKAINYGYIIKQFDSEIDILETEIKRLKELKTKREQSVELLRENIKQALELYGITEIKADTFKISLRNSESVECENWMLTSEYQTTKVTITPDKNKIKKDIKAGVNIPGAKLVTNINLQIK